MTTTTHLINNKTIVNSTAECVIWIKYDSKNILTYPLSKNTGATASYWRFTHGYNNYSIAKLLTKDDCNRNVARTQKENLKEKKEEKYFHNSIN